MTASAGSCPQCGFLMPAEAAAGRLCPRCLLLANFDTEQDTAASLPGSSLSTDLTGSIFDNKYRIERLLGRGGMGSVFLATHLGTKRLVALKLIAERLAGQPDFQSRFRREAQALGRLRHPNVINVIDFDVTIVDGRDVAFLAMEYLDGSNLALYQQQHSPLPIALVLDIVEQVASALDTAHALGIIHRDLKPENIWLEPNRFGGYNARVLDFGLAKVMNSIDASELLEEPPEPGSSMYLHGECAESIETQPMALTGETHTRAGSVLGTPAYMPPEQFRGKALDGKADIYSLAVITYSMLAGQLPFQGSSAELMRQHLNEPPLPLRYRTAGVSKAVSDVVLSGLSKDPADRPQTAGAFASRLRASAELERVYLRRGRAFVSMLPVMTTWIILLNTAGIVGLALLLLNLLSLSGLRGVWLEGAAYVSFAATLLIAGNWGKAAWSISLQQVLANRRYRVSSIRALASYMKALPVLLQTQLAAILRPSLHRHCLWPVVCVFEGRRGFDALNRSQQLTAFTRHAAFGLTVRLAALALIGTVYVFLPEIGSALFTREGFTAGPIFAMYIGLGGLSVQFFAAFPLFYLRARQTLGECDASEFDTVDIPEFPRNWIRGVSRASLVWLAAVGLALALSLYVRLERNRGDRSYSLVDAAETGRLSEMQRLLASGADVRSTKGPWTPLARASMFGQQQIVAALLDAGADINYNEKSVGTALYLAVVANQNAVVKLLLERGADPNLAPSWGKTPLMVAAGHGDLPTVELLLRHGADPNRKSRYGSTAATDARSEKHWAVLEVLQRAVKQK